MQDFFHEKFIEQDVILLNSFKGQLGATSHPAVGEIMCR